MQEPYATMTVLKRRYQCQLRSTRRQWRTSRSNLERGVEWETLSCGTGVTAAAIAHILHQDRPNGHYEVPIKAKGGELLIKFDHKGKTIENVWLCGPAEMVFEGRV
ncbi:MAG: hypothetical protein R2769_12180 [Saprospiraceae bacterium]